MKPIAPPDGNWRSTLRTGHPLVGAIWNVAAARPAGLPDLSTALRSARYRLLGEIHDNPDHHALQLRLLRDLVDAGTKPLLAFEQFDAEHDRSLQDRLARGQPDVEEIAAAVSFNRSGWNWDFYRPLVEVALQHGLPLRAANLSSAATRSIVSDGLSALGAERLAELRLDAAWNPQREAALRAIIFEGHCRALPERLLPGMAGAQRARDATLAQSLTGAAADGAVLICGNGHARRDLGVPLYLPTDRGTTCAIGIAEVEGGKDRPGDYDLAGVDAIAPFDFICFTPGWDRPDPCAGFKPRSAQ